MAQILNDTNFASEVDNYEGGVLVDFFAPWCGPCQMLMPIIDKLAEEYAGKFKIVKVNVDESPQISMREEIMSIPTLKFFKNGKELEVLMGMQSPDLLRQKIAYWSA
ncbi:MAG TPA: thioredoxin [Candidatus Gracilibacteria bacterium]|nr:thioredoxin [Candidatus Gracilibacteria bacterium]